MSDTACSGASGSGNRKRWIAASLLALLPLLASSDPAVLHETALLNRADLPLHGKTVLIRLRATMPAGLVSC